MVKEIMPRKSEAYREGKKWRVREGAVVGAMGEGRQREMTKAREKERGVYI